MHAGNNTQFTAGLQSPPAATHTEGPCALAQVKYQMEDLSVGQKMTGTVKAVHDFGVFVDIGAPRDALLNTERFTVGCSVHETWPKFAWVSGRSSMIPGLLAARLKRSILDRKFGLHLPQRPTCIPSWLEQEQQPPAVQRGCALILPCAALGLCDTALLWHACAP